MITLIWQERSIEVSYQANWLNSGHWHIELRSAEPLPVTATGYRSQFVVADIIESAADIEAYVSAWLDQAAKDPAWKRLVEERRQFTLFYDRQTKRRVPLCHPAHVPYPRRHHPHAA
ncbi:MAG: hypothetical protein AB3N21_18860 [Ruegeria sp.]|uniref:hypothetical protein n=1 Tax=Ruegeria sp. TaxID=1879320 RepID=UPI00349EBFBE